MESTFQAGRYERAQHVGRSRGGFWLLGGQKQLKRRAGSRFQRPSQQFLGQLRLFCGKLLAALFLSHSAFTNTSSAGPCPRTFTHTMPLLGVPSPRSCQYTPASSRSLCHSLVLKGSVPSLKLSHCHSTSRTWTANSNIWSAQARVNKRTNVCSSLCP